MVSLIEVKYLISSLYIYSFYYMEYHMSMSVEIYILRIADEIIVSKYAYFSIHICKKRVLFAYVYWILKGDDSKYFWNFYFNS